jgi:predicted DsbA family dithiol-disulfide isomerase
MRWGLEGTVVLDETAEYARRLGIRGVPTNVFVDESGVVQALGASTFDDLLAEAASLEPRLRDDADVAGAARVPSDFD